jgi:uncharacterized protein DUF3108
MAIGMLTLGVSPVFADRIDARYEIFGFAGLHVLTNRTSAEERPDGYAIATNLGTRGIASAFVDLRSHSKVYGKLTDTAVRPEAYQAEVWRNGTDRSYALKYLKDGSVINATPAPAQPASYLDGVQSRGTVDQLTAYFLVERQLARTGSCQLTVPVFDGNELYRLRFSDVKDETLSPDNHQDFAGATHVCDVVRNMIVANPDKKEGTYDRGRIWYGRVLPVNRVVPVRMEYETPFGNVAAYLAEVTGYGARLNFTGE